MVDGKKGSLPMDYDNEQDFRPARKAAFQHTNEEKGDSSSPESFVTAMSHIGSFSSSSPSTLGLSVAQSSVGRSAAGSDETLRAQSLPLSVVDSEMTDKETSSYMSDDEADDNDSGMGLGIDLSKPFSSAGYDWDGFSSSNESMAGVSDESSEYDPEASSEDDSDECNQGVLLEWNEEISTKGYEKVSDGPKKHVPPRSEPSPFNECAEIFDENLPAELQVLIHKHHRDLLYANVTWKTTHSKFGEQVTIGYVDGRERITYTADLPSKLLPDLGIPELHKGDDIALWIEVVKERATANGEGLSDRAKIKATKLKIASKPKNRHLAEFDPEVDLEQCFDDYLLCLEHRLTPKTHTDEHMWDELFALRQGTDKLLTYLTKCGEAAKKLGVDPKKNHFFRAFLLRQINPTILKSINMSLDDDEEETVHEISWVHLLLQAGSFGGANAAAEQRYAQRHIKAKQEEIDRAAAEERARKRREKREELANQGVGDPGLALLERMRSTGTLNYR